MHRLGMVMATSGLIPELLAVLDSMTAQRHWGLCFPMARTALQHPLDGAAFGSCAADAHGASLSAILSGGVAPHSPAPSARHAAAASRRARRAPGSAAARGGGGAAIGRVGGAIWEQRARRRWPVVGFGIWRGGRWEGMAWWVGKGRHNRS